MHQAGSCAGRPPAFVRSVLAGAGGDVKLLTLAVVRAGGRVLLGRKKRGFGEGYVNGFGGKVEPGETVAAAAAREIQEEAGIVAGRLTRRGVLTFVFDDQPKPWEVHVFTASEFEGRPVETDEMRPEWFDARDDAIPYDEMWADDRFWWPLLLRGDAPLFQGLFAFTGTHTLGWWRLREVASLEGSGREQLLPPDGGGGGGAA